MGTIVTAHPVYPGRAPRAHVRAIRRRKAQVLDLLSSKISTNSCIASISTPMTLWTLRLACLLDKSMARCDDAGCHRAESRSKATDIARATIFTHSFSFHAYLCNRSHAMRDRTGAVCVPCDLGTPDLQRNDTTTAVQRPIKPRFAMRALAALYAKTGLTYHRETWLSRVAQRTASIGGDREAAAGTRQATNGSRSSATSACFFGSLISDEAVCMIPMRFGVEVIHRVRRTDQQDTL